MNKLYIKRLKVAIFSIFLLAFLFAIMTGCGRLDVNVHTTVTPSGSIIQRLSYTGSGMIGGLLSDSMSSVRLSTDLQKQGWQIETKQSGDSTTITATKKFERGDVLSMPDIANASDLSIIRNLSIKGVKFNVNNYIVVRDYYFEATLIGTPASNLTGNSNEWEKGYEALANSMFGMSWSFTLPGKVVETNADNTEANTATWYFNLSSLQNDRYMIVHSRYIDWLLGVIIIVGVMIFLAAIIFLSKYMRRHKLTI